MLRLSLTDLRRAGYEVFGRDQYVVNWCGHGQEFITVPDTAGMWWLCLFWVKRREHLPATSPPRTRRPSWSGCWVW